MGLRRVKKTGKCWERIGVGGRAGLRKGGGRDERSGGLGRDRGGGGEVKTSSMRTRNIKER